MKPLNLILLITCIYTTNILAQTKIKLKSVSERNYVRYSTREATIIFSKEDLINTFEQLPNKTEQEILFFDSLKNTSTSIDLIGFGFDSTSSKNKDFLRKIIRIKLAVNLISLGKATIYRISDNKRQRHITGKKRNSLDRWEYNFFFQKSKEAFFTTFVKSEFVIKNIIPLDKPSDQTEITIKSIKKNEPILKYTTRNAILLFRKNDIVKALEGIPDKTSRELEVMNYVQQASNEISGVEHGSTQSKNDSDLFNLILNKLAVDLFIAGRVGVIQVLDNKKQIAIWYKKRMSPEHIHYSFSFQDGKTFITNSFLKQESEKENISQKPLEDEDIIYFVNEQSAEPIKGITLFNEYLTRSLIYPSKAKEEKIEGTSFIAFVVGVDGILSEITVIKSLSPECDQEAIRLIKEGGNWKPGKQNGKARKVRFVLPVKFKLPQ